VINSTLVNFFSGKHYKKLTVLRLDTRHSASNLLLFNIQCPMTKSQNACCPGCGEPISFRKFVLLNNFSATNCDACNTRIEISNRNANAIIAGVSGCVSAACVVLCAYFGQKNYDSLLGGLASGMLLAALIIVFICRYAYRHSVLNKINVEYRLRTGRMLQMEQGISSIEVKST
jgi:hypothetical protein